MCFIILLVVHRDKIKLIVVLLGFVFLFLCLFV